MAVTIRSNNSQVTLKASTDQGEVRASLATPTVTIKSGDGGATSYLGLTDTDNTYAGQASKYVSVKGDETGLEFTTVTTTTNLNYTASPTDGTVTSDTGTDATIPLADNTNAGLLSPSQKTILDNTSNTNSGDQNLFSTIAVSGQNSVVADSTSDTLNLVAGTNITITTDNTTDSITINSTTSVDDPTFTTSPTISNISYEQVDIDFALDTFGRFWYVILPQGATAPSSTQIKAGTDSTDTPVTLNGAYNFYPYTTVSDTLTGLVNNTGYDLYYAPEGAVKNLAIANYVNFTTLDAGVTYLFDTYSAILGYSVSRALSSTATVAFRVRRSSDSTEQDIGFDAGGLVDTASLLSFVGAGTGYVTKVYNQGSGGATYDLVQTTTGNQPQLVSSGVVITDNGKPAMSFNGTTHYLSNPNSYAYTSGVSWYVVANITTIGSAYRTWSDDITGVQGNVIAYINGDYRLNDNGTGYKTQVISGASAGVQQLGVFNFNSSTGAYNGGFNGSLSTGTIAGWTGPIAPSGASNIGLMGSGDGSQLASGKMQELIVYNSDQSANRTAIESDINTHYTIY